VLHTDSQIWHFCVRNIRITAAAQKLYTGQHNVFGGRGTRVRKYVNKVLTSVTVQQVKIDCRNKNDSVTPAIHLLLQISTAPVSYSAMSYVSLKFSNTLLVKLHEMSPIYCVGTGEYSSLVHPVAVCSTSRAVNDAICVTSYTSACINFNSVSVGQNM